MAAHVTREIITRAARNEFRETFTFFSLREIEIMFETADLRPDLTCVPPVSGQRRSLVEQYYAAIDFANPSDVRTLLGAYEELLLRLESPNAAGL